MSNRRKTGNPRPQNPISAQIAALDGARIPGGCGHCDAYQVVNAMQGDPDFHVLRVYHDEDCTWLAARQGRQ